MTIISELTDRRAELERLIEGIDQTIADSERERALRAAELSGIVYAIQVIEREETLCAGAQAAPESTRAKRRNIRQMVLDWLEATGPCTVGEIAAGCEIRPSAAERTVDHLITKGKVTGHGGGSVRLVRGPSATQAEGDGAGALAQPSGASVAASERYVGSESPRVPRVLTAAD